MTIRATEASSILKAAGFEIAPTRLRYGIAQGVYPFGDAITTKKKTIIKIYPKLLDAWIKEHK